MLMDLLAVLHRAVHWPLHQIERRVDQLSPGLRGVDLPALIGLALLSTLFSWLLFLAETFLFNLIIRPRLPTLSDNFLHAAELSLFIISLGAVSIVGIIKIRRDYKRDADQLRQEISDLINRTSDLQTLFEEAKARQADATIDLFKAALRACKGEEPLKIIIEGLTPDNAKLAEKLDTLRKETSGQLVLLNRLATLPFSARLALSEFLKPDFSQEPWAPLYLTFAIQLQLTPWVRNRSTRYVFVRDIDELIETGPEQLVAFRYSLEEDFQTILSFVNGSLWSVVYRDLYNSRGYLHRFFWIHIYIVLLFRRDSRLLSGHVSASFLFSSNKRKAWNHGPLQAPLPGTTTP